MHPVRMHERVVYAETFAHGRTALELDPDSIAGREIAGLWAAVKERFMETEKERFTENEKGIRNGQTSIG